MQKTYLGLTWLVLGAFLLLLATGCTDTVVGSALTVATPEPTATPVPPTPTPFPMPKCPWKKPQIVVPRSITAPDSKTTVYIVPDETDPALERIVTEGIRSDDSFEGISAVVFSPDKDRFAVMGRLDGQERVVEFMVGESYENFVDVVGDRTQMGDWNDWLCYSASGKFLMTLALENGQWFLLYNECDERDDVFERVALQAKPTAIELLPPRGKQEGISYKVKLSSIETNSEELLTPKN